MSDFDKLKIRKLDGGLLLIFRELLTHKRASDVAQRLGLSQSAISHALARLREIFGDPLFIRRAHGFEPTQRALQLGPRINALIDQIGATVSSDERFDPAASRRRFVIGAPDSIMSLIAAPLLESFRREAPSAIFAVRWAMLRRALSAVRRGEIDLALGVFRDIPRGLKAEKICEDEYCVLARRGHPRVRGRIDLKTYANIGHLFVGNPDGALSDDVPLDRAEMDATYGALPDPNRIRTHGYVVQWETAMLAAADSDVLVECPRRLAQKYAKRLGLQVLDPPYKPFRFTIQAVRRDGDDPAVEWLTGCVKAALA